jgi:hypothetical protein
MIIENMFDIYGLERLLIIVTSGLNNLGNFKDEQGERLHQNMKGNGGETSGKGECQRDNSKVLLVPPRGRF